MKTARAWAGTFAAAASALVVLAPAATAAPDAATLSITGAVVAANDTVNVDVTYTCDAGYAGTLVGYVNDTTASAFGVSNDTAATCDGASHTAVLSVDNENEAADYKAGDSAVVAVSLDATKAGSPDQNAAQDVTRTLG
ncbi:hypothetical protein [Amycolatopsis sp. NPDC058986]|uniref:hypothetical protein n=1 Tax=unclassified Amycolatopsis TaxID=2618356 RepID=UPI00366E9C54